MSINVNAKKIVIVGLVLAVALAVSLTGYYLYSTKDARTEAARYEKLVKFANRQAVEIAVIEQSVKLAEYRKQMTAAQAQPPMPVQKEE